MVSVWLSVLFVPWIHMNVLLKVIHTQASACGKVKTSASVVAAGSPISASCVIDSDCPLTTSNKEFRVEWKINHDLVPSNLSYLESNGTYAVFIPQIPGLIADITCSVCVKNNCQIIDGSIVKVGSRPAIPRNLSCVMSLKVPRRMLCQWDPGQESANIPTKYTLHTNIRATSKSFQYVLTHGEHFYWIPQGHMTLFLEMEIYVEAVNIFGKASSPHLLLVPMKSAKYGPPDIQRIQAFQFGCLEYRWSLPESQSWVKENFYVELSIKEVKNLLAKELVFPSRVSQLSTINVCGLFHGTNYSTKMRVRYSDLWSEWSVSKVASTLIKAPSGRLDTWLKVPDDDEDDLISQLYWKPSQQFRVNGWNVWYTVESKEPKQTLCVTRENHCSFKLSKRVTMVYLTASNANGSSSPTEVPVYKKKGLDPVSNVSVHSQSENSVLIAWESSAASRVTGYVLDWRISETHSAKLFFRLLDKNQSSTLLTGFEPYKPYDISVYPKYVDGLGRCYSVIAYSSEKAPSVAPKLRFGEIHSSNVQLLWDEIPIQQRNGIIQGYTIFFWDKRQNIQILRTKKTNVLVRDLQPLSTYEVIISIHTLGGSLNGSVVTLKTQQIGGFAVVLLVIPVCVGFSLLFLIAVFTCLGKHERLKMCLWPIIPDPANSSIKRWTTLGSLQGMPPFNEDKDPALVYLSHFSFVDLSDKELRTSDYVEDNQWSQESGDQNKGHNSWQNTESVPYATVVFGGPYKNQTGSSPVYLRSESTQPLLGVEDPGSPPPYENMSASVSVNYFTTIPQESTDNKALWEDFPMLRSFEIRNTDHI